MGNPDQTTIEFNKPPQSVTRKKTIAVFVALFVFAVVYFLLYGICAFLRIDFGEVCAISFYVSIIVYTYKNYLKQNP